MQKMIQIIDLTLKIHNNNNNNNTQLFYMS